MKSTKTTSYWTETAEQRIYDSANLCETELTGDIA